MSTDNNNICIAIKNAYCNNYMKIPPPALRRTIGNNIKDKCRNFCKDTTDYNCYGSFTYDNKCFICNNDDTNFSSFNKINNLIICNSKNAKQEATETFESTKNIFTKYINKKTGAKNFNELPDKEKNRYGEIGNTSGKYGLIGDDDDNYLKRSECKWDIAKDKNNYGLIGTKNGKYGLIGDDDDNYLKRSECKWDIAKDKNNYGLIGTKNGEYGLIGTDNGKYGLIGTKNGEYGLIGEEEHNYIPRNTCSTQSMIGGGGDGDYWDTE